MRMGTELLLESEVATGFPADPGGEGASKSAGAPLQCWMIRNCSAVGLISVISTLKPGWDWDGYLALMWDKRDLETTEVGA